MTVKDLTNQELFDRSLMLMKKIQIGENVTCDVEQVLEELEKRLRRSKSEIHIVQNS